MSQHNGNNFPFNPTMLSGPFLELKRPVASTESYFAFLKEILSMLKHITPQARVCIIVQDPRSTADINFDLVCASDGATPNDIINALHRFRDCKPHQQKAGSGLII